MLEFKWLDKAVWRLLEIVFDFLNNNFKIHTDNKYFNLHFDLHIDVQSRLGDAIHFFIYDTIKIIILLSVMIFIMSFIRSFFPPEKTKVMLEKVKGVKGNILGSLLGIVTPFCSCSSVPIFIGFVSSGVPLGITFSFLITSPMVNEAVFIMLLSGFGWKVATVYVITGILIGVIGGIIIDKSKMEKYVEDFVYGIESKNVLVPNMKFKDRINFSVKETGSVLGRVWKWIIIGILIGAIIHGWIPKDFIVNIAGPNNPVAVILATILAVPLYSNAIGTIPIAQALISKGMAIGTAMAFMMATTALSLPEMILLRKVIKPKLILFFITIVTISIIIVGYLFNIIL